MTPAELSPARAMLQWRENMGITKAEAGRLLGVTRQNIGAIESFRSNITPTMRLLMDCLLETKRRGQNP